MLEELGDGEGDVELDEPDAGEVELADGDFPVEFEVLGVDDGLLLAEADVLLLPDLLADAETEADLLGVWLRGTMVAAVSTVPFGGEEHVW